MGCGMCKKCGGVHKIVVGALLLLNAFLWPQWLGIDGWISWLAVLFVIGGALKLFVPNKCPACNDVSAPSPAKKKRKK